MIFWRFLAAKKMNCNEMDRDRQGLLANRNCYNLLRVSWALAQISCYVYLSFMCCGWCQLASTMTAATGSWSLSILALTAMQRPPCYTLQTPLSLYLKVCISCQRNTCFYWQKRFCHWWHLVRQKLGLNWQSANICSISRLTLEICTELCHFKSKIYHP